MFGWIGTILRINLSAKTWVTQPLEDIERLQFLGGRGINSSLLYQEVPPHCDAFSPHNSIIVGSSPLTGTATPSAARCTITAKSPLTGILGDANFGGYFAPAMKKAGYDHIIIQGVSEKPVYLFITEDGVVFKDAAHLWRRTTRETEEQIKGELHNRKTQVASIGPAGENLVRTSCVVHNYNVAGRTGMGAVMGSKNLKAIAVSGGKRSIGIAHPASFRDNIKKWNNKIKENPMCQHLRRFGAAGPLNIYDEAGVLAIKNFEQTSGFAGVEEVSAEALAKYFTKPTTCFGCPVRCIQGYEVTEGTYKGTKGAKMPEGCNSPCGPGCGNTNAASLFKLFTLANEYGIDILDFGNTMAVAMDWFEHGIIGTEDTDGIPLNWGNH